MGIQLKQLRVHGFRGLDNLEVDFEQTTVLVGTNNSGKTTLLKALQLALSNTLQISDDDFFFSDVLTRNKIVIDILFISVDESGNRVNEFEDKWATVFTDERIGFEGDQQFMGCRTIIQEDSIKETYKKKQYVIDTWDDFNTNDNGFWYEREYTMDLSFYFDEIPFFYLDANRDILEDLKSKSSYLGKILSSIKYDEADKNDIEKLIEDLNKTTIDKSDILSDLQKALQELDTTMDNQNTSVEITPFTKKLRDLNKGVKINYSQFSMEYHGMGTRSWSSLLILKAFLIQGQKLAANKKVAYHPIIAIEEPEAHLHPNAQKKLYSQIVNMIGQKLISTHSSYIAGSAKLKEVRSLYKGEKNTLVGKLIESEFENEDKRKIERQVVNTRGELFFSKLVILFEGETEEQVLPVLVQKFFGKNSIELGVDFIGVGGEGNYLPFIRFFEAFSVPYLIFSDNEQKANASITKQINQSKTKDISKVVFLNSGNDFENELCTQGYIDEVKNAYKKIELAKCKTPQHKTEKEKELNQIPDNDYYAIMTKIKTQFAPFLADELYTSEKQLPEKIIELFEKVNGILKPVNYENN